MSSSVQHKSIFSEVDLIKNETSTSSSGNVTKGDVCNSLVSVADTAKNSSDVSDKPKIYKLGELRVSVRDIKNISPNLVRKRFHEGSKAKSKKLSKKQKSDMTCCGEPNHNCIRKYFGQKCGQYRV